MQPLRMGNIILDRGYAGARATVQVLEVGEVEKLTPPAQGLRGHQFHYLVRATKLKWDRPGKRR